jgi:hypothetical protein
VLEGIKNYHNLLDSTLEHCRVKEYYCSKIPGYIF